MRYKKVSSMVTDLDKHEDVVGWIEGLRSRSYLSDLIEQFHAPVITDRAAALASRIQPLVETALNYLEQAEKGPSQVAFLPLYYAVLNLSKVYVMLGPFRGQLEGSGAHRRHGAQYDPSWNDQLRLERQKVRLHRNGVLGLFYRTLTGENWITASVDITMARVYPFINKASGEYHLITGKPAKLSPLRVHARQESGTWRLACGALFEIPHSRELAYVPVLRSGHWYIDGDTFVSNHGVATEDTALDLADCCMRRELVYNGRLLTRGTGDKALVQPIMAVNNAFPSMPEEFPILVAFFYQASIARYKPEFMARQLDSKLWPLLVALRRHGTFAFLLAFWSFIRQESVYLEAA